MENLENLKIKLKNIEEFLKTELSALRVGRATPALVENILADYHGAKIPIKQIASISVPESRLLVIEPWDKSVIGNIEKAILVSDLGLNPIVDKNLIRITIPSLTEERRNSLIKILGAKLEDAKVKCRAVRDEAIKELSDLLNAKKITEDDKFKTKERIQEAINESVKNLETISNAKEKEIKEI